MVDGGIDCLIFDGSYQYYLVGQLKSLILSKIEMSTDQIAQTIAKLSADIKALHRDVRKIKQHMEDPTGEKAEARSRNNGFKKPINVTDDLRNFLGLAPDALISRADVTQSINKYAEENKLKEGQVIKMDDKLRAILNPPEGFEMTFLKLQHFLKPHYVKIDAPVDVDKAPKKPRVKKN